MTRVAVAAALILTWACAGRSQDRIQSTFAAAQHALWRGELTDAATLTDQGLGLMRGEPDSELAWRFRLLRAEIEIARLNFPGALPLLSAPLPGGPRFDSLRAQQKYLEAKVLLARGQLPSALDALDKALRLAPSARDVRLDVEVLGGQIRMRLERWGEAESRLNAVVAAAAESGDRYHQALALNNLGMGRFVRNRWDQALSWFEQVLSLADLEQTTVYSAALTNAGMCYARLGQFERALASQRRSIDLHEHRGSRGDLERTVGQFGNTCMLQGDVRRGLPYYQRALALATESDLASDAAIWAGNLASAYVELGEWNEAERLNGEAQRLKASSHSGNVVYNALKSAQIAEGRGQLDQATRFFEKALAGANADPSVRWDAQAGLASVAVAAKQPDRAARHFEAALDTIEQTRSDLLKTEYKLSFLTRLIRFYQNYVDALVDQGKIERALEIADSSRGRVLAERQGVAAPARANAAMFRRVADQSNAVVLSYWLGPSRSYMWIVTGTGIRCLPLPPARDIEKLAREHQSTVESSLVDPLAVVETAGDRLYQLLVAPAMTSIPNGAGVIVVPDGALHGINFETLPVAGPRRHYWIDDVEIQVAPSLALLSAKAAAPAAPSLLLIGDPTPREPDFPRLRYASAEMTDVSRHFERASVTAHQGPRASPAAFREAHPDRFRYLHFTAHAAANRESPLDSAVILSGPQDAFKLYARDVAELGLRAELVTVSACRSAGEHAYSGEGLVGFAWAFLRAGARRVIAGLWDVDDQSTAALMNDLYARITAGDSPARALRAAKLALIRRGGNYVKPYYWGPFELFTVSP
jgi:CHAT domain-containing protein/tetratricopeptide (TPR) repeat protein